MKKIFKYELTNEMHQSIETYADAEIIKAAYQGEKPCVWLIIDDENAKALRHIHIVGTSWHLHGSYSKENHIHTVFNGPFVRHLFDMGQDL